MKRHSMILLLVLLILPALAMAKPNRDTERANCAGACAEMLVAVEAANCWLNPKQCDGIPPGGLVAPPADKPSTEPPTAKDECKIIVNTRRCRQITGTGRIVFEFDRPTRGSKVE